MNHNTLENYYRTTFAMIHYHKYDASYIEDLMVFEKDIIVSMLMEASKK